MSRSICWSCSLLLLLLVLAPGCKKHEARKLNLAGKWENQQGRVIEFFADGSGLIHSATGGTKLKYKVIDDRKIEIYKEDGATKISDWQVISFSDSEIAIRTDSGTDDRLRRK
ncbi:MAG TPA: hypothetical protein VKS79_18235 [Gemmataceae bacterium]|nr:hypothetical protein [Gemmataceae bacterium]